MQGQFIDRTEVLLTQTSVAISKLKFPFHLKGHQHEAVDAWISSGLRGSIIYSSGTGKTEIAFECARRAADIISVPSSPLPTTDSSMFILLLVPRIVLIAQYLKRLSNYGISIGKIGVYFGERKVIREITISTYQSVIYNPDLIRRSKMIIFDEVHLVSDTSKVLKKVFDIALEDASKALLGCRWWWSATLILVLLSLLNTASAIMVATSLSTPSSLSRISTAILTNSCSVYGFKCISLNLVRSGGNNLSVLLDDAKTQVFSCVILF
jgi:Type III restriction enzyme, res subunit